MYFTAKKKHSQRVSKRKYFNQCMFREFPKKIRCLEELGVNTENRTKSIILRHVVFDKKI